jgi:hypothetical protein
VITSVQAFFLFIANDINYQNMGLFNPLVDRAISFVELISLLLWLLRSSFARSLPAADRRHLAQFSSDIRHGEQLFDTWTCASRPFSSEHECHPEVLV